MPTVFSASAVKEDVEEYVRIFYKINKTLRGYGKKIASATEVGKKTRKEFHEKLNANERLIAKFSGYWFHPDAQIATDISTNFADLVEILDNEGIASGKIEDYEQLQQADLLNLLRDLDTLYSKITAGSVILGGVLGALTCLVDYIVPKQYRMTIVRLLGLDPKIASFTAQITKWLQTVCHISPATATTMAPWITYTLAILILVGIASAVTYIFFPDTALWAYTQSVGFISMIAQIPENIFLNIQTVVERIFATDGTGGMENLDVVDIPTAEYVELAPVH